MSTAPPNTSTPRWRSDLLAALLLGICALAVYAPALRAGFIWDDDAHVTWEGLRSWQGLWRIWSEPGAAAQYYPLVHTVFWIEYALWGDFSFPYHLQNVLLHALAGFLILKILRFLAAPGAAWAALLFVVHPLQVESVAWVSELKNTLSSVLYLAAALTYLHFDETRRRRSYAGAMGLFLLALLCKTVTASLPAALLIVFWWKRGRLSWKRDVLPLIPFWGLGAAAGLFTVWMERTFIGATGHEYNFTAIERCLIAGRAVWFYIGKLLWPQNLMFIYPRWEINESIAWQYLFPIATLGFLAGLWMLRRRFRAPLAAFAFFTATLFPALGFVNVFPFRFSFVADHFQYLAGIGPFALAGAGIALLLERVQRFRSASIGLLALIPCTLGILSWRQSAIYRDTETLWLATLARNPKCWMAYNELGCRRLEEGRHADATGLFREALRVNPDYADAYANLGNVLLQLGQTQEAMAQFREALRINPSFASARNNLGLALMQAGEFEDAATEFREALRVQRLFMQGELNLGNALLAGGQVAEAIVHFREALRINPAYAEAHNSLGNALLQLGQKEKALAEYHEALRLRPELVEAHYNLANVLLQHNDFAAARDELQIAVDLRPADVNAVANLAWLLATAPDTSLRDGTKAVALARKATEQTESKSPKVLRILAAALAQNGQFPEAIETARKARRLLDSQTNGSLIDTLDTEIASYEAGRRPERSR